MLVRLEYNQILENWSDICDSIKASGPPLSDLDDGQLDEILHRMSTDNMQCWVLCTMEEDLSTTVYAIATTTIWRELAGSNVNLLIYSLYGYRPVTNELWKDGLDTLRRFARSMGCKEIVAFTSVQRVISIVENLGGSTNTRLVRLEV